MENFFNRISTKFIILYWAEFSNKILKKSDAFWKFITGEYFKMIKKQKPTKSKVEALLIRSDSATNTISRQFPRS